MSVLDGSIYRKSFDSNFIGVTARLARVPNQIARLNDALAEHAIREPAILAAGYDERDGEPTYRIPHPSTWLPQEAQAIVGEIVHNLRSALDNLVWLLAYRNCGHEVKQTQFLIVETRTDFDKQQPRRLKGLTNDQVDTIEKVQPYNGDDWLRLLADLSNPDKHRHLLLLENLAPMDIVFTESGVTIPPHPPKWVLMKKYDPIPTLEYLHRHVLRVARALAPSAF